MNTRQSLWANLSFWKILFFWLIFPIVIPILKSLNNRAEIGDKTIKQTWGILNKNSEEYAIAGIVSIDTHQSLFGRIFNYGDVILSIAGEKKIYLVGYVAPNEIKKHLQSILEKTADHGHSFIN